MTRSALILAVAATALGCGDDNTGPDAMTPDADTPMDGGVPDALADTGPPPEIEVSYDDGAVVGRTVDGVHQFLGIPYAAPPIGDLRFRPPEAVEPWTEPRDASELGAQCPQINVLAGAATVEGDEDCLFLNVFSPDTAPTTPMPVIVWIHGGAFVLGNGGRSPGRLAAVSSTVVVTLNYRLDTLGFLAHPALSAEGSGSSGNYGLLDQRAALVWVRDHVAAFGGDPDNVTIMGESAGGISVGLHAASPGSAGLFHRAIVESGPIDLVRLPELAEAELRGSAIADRAGCSDPGTAAACLRAASVEDLVVEADLRASPGGLFYQNELPMLVPVVDGVVLPEQPVAAYASGGFEHVPFLIGSNGDEGTLFHHELISTPVTDEAEYRAALGRLYPDDVDAIVAMYPVSSFESANAALTAVTSDLATCGTRGQARSISDAGVATWLYAFEAVPLGTLAALGSYHGAELVYLFDTSSLDARPRPDERDLVDAMQGYWTRFAATGDPNGAGAPAWPSYDTAMDRHMQLVSPPMAGEGYRMAACDFWYSLRMP